MELELPTTSSESWHVEANGQVYETNLDEMQAWIAEGSLLRIDRVRKGNLRWIEAGKVPALTEFFNAKDAAEPPPPVITTTHTEVLGVSEFQRVAAESGAANPTSGQGANVSETSPTVAPAAAVCSVHADAAAAYICDTCSNAFCNACPNSYGGTVKICPFCGAMCKSLAALHKQAETHDRRVRDGMTGSFGFGDFGNALAHPFKFKFSLVAGAVMFALFSLGQAAVSFGGIFMMASAVFCFLLANMMWFGVLGTTIENFVQGKFDENFMPSFDDFSIWDDVVHPFFLSIAAYISSFGPFIAVLIVAAFFVLGAVRGEMNAAQDETARAINPELPYAAKAANQSQAVRELIDRNKETQRRRIAAIENGDEEELEQATPVAPGQLPQHAIDEEQEFERMNKLINQQRKDQLESTIGKTPETKAKEQAEFVKRLLGYGVVFVLLLGVTLLWGLFYFPAACAVAGYTRSFGAAINPLVGLDTIKRLGGSYALLLLMGLMLMIMSGLVSGVFGMIFSAFDMPAVGNLPAKFFGSMFGFYISVVFSCLLGYALHKKADKLDLPT